MDVIDKRRDSCVSWSEGQHLPLHSAGMVPLRKDFDMSSRSVDMTTTPLTAFTSCCKVVRTFEMTAL